tara:strand:+ start:480 stop:635 length:156 start_codon:yes stop_codon:yes gene_type:complete
MAVVEVAEVTMPLMEQEAEEMVVLHVTDQIFLLLIKVVVEEETEHQQELLE